MAFFPRLPEGMGPVRKFNTLMVVVITSCLLGQRFYQREAVVVDTLETVLTVAGIGLLLGVAVQLIGNRGR
jgi:hypothetical protein